MIKTCDTADLELDISAETFSPPDEGTLAITIASYTWLHVLFLRLAWCDIDDIGSHMIEHYHIGYSVVKGHEVGLPGTILPPM